MIRRRGRRNEEVVRCMPEALRVSGSDERGCALNKSLNVQEMKYDHGECKICFRIHSTKPARQANVRPNLAFSFQ